MFLPANRNTKQNRRTTPLYLTSERRDNGVRCQERERCATFVFFSCWRCSRRHTPPTALADNSTSTARGSSGSILIMPVCSKNGLASLKSFLIPFTYPEPGRPRASANLQATFGASIQARHGIDARSPCLIVARQKTTLLRIGGAHRRTTVFVNGVELGGHDGFSAPLISTSAAQYVPVHKIPSSFGLKIPQRQSVSPRTNRSLCFPQACSTTSQTGAEFSVQSS